MFQKILVAEDLDTISLAVIQALRELSVLEIHHAKYCDDAFLKIKKALHDQVPYDLLISDLSFKPDHRHSKLTSGEELLQAVKKEQPELKTIVFSIEDKSYRIKHLFTSLGINGYVSKGRDSIPELKRTIEDLYNNKKYNPSAEVNQALRNKSLFEIEAYDISLLKSL